MTDAHELYQTDGLKSALDGTILSTYDDAIDLAIKETGLPIETFPSRCPYTKDQVLDDDFYPTRDGNAPQST